MKIFDAAKAENLNNEISTSIIKASKEIERIKQTFNNEAEDLRVGKPFFKVTPIVKTKYRPGYSYTFILETIRSLLKYISAGGYECGYSNNYFKLRKS